MMCYLYYSNSMSFHPIPHETLTCPVSIRYQGFQSARVTWSPTPNENGTRIKTAQVIFESTELAEVAKQDLDGFLLKKGWVLSVSYI